MNPIGFEGEGTPSPELQVHCRVNFIHKVSKIGGFSVPPLQKAHHLWSTFGQNFYS